MIEDIDLKINKLQTIESCVGMFYLNYLNFYIIIGSKPSRSCSFFDSVARGIRVIREKKKKKKIEAKRKRISKMFLRGSMEYFRRR